MIDRFTDILICPVCKRGVCMDGNRLLCLGGKHSFDRAREGQRCLEV